MDIRQTLKWCITRYMEWNFHKTVEFSLCLKYLNPEEECFLNNLAQGESATLSKNSGKWSVACLLEKVMLGR